MAKKDYTTINADEIGSVKNSDTTAKMQRSKDYTRAQKTASTDEQAARAASMKTQGRKGCKATRVNMILTPNNHSFIKVMSGALGMSMAEVTNYIINRFQSEHAEYYNAVKPCMEIRETIKKG